jgi:D-beta-D-heptose 7-phosphate kinase/D-beta-D-heptose 1-phosphate adenosyltransferase
LQLNNKKIVFTNGCFDILHIGHIRYLEKAKEYGDILIIGLNSDESVRRLKGDLRPISTQEDRALLLSALQFVDYVVLFEEDTPYNLIQQISPDILIKGADYQDKEVVGSELVKELILIDFISGKSTTNIINKIKKQG